MLVEVVSGRVMSGKWHFKSISLFGCILNVWIPRIFLFLVIFTLLFALIALCSCSHWLNLTENAFHGEPWRTDKMFHICVSNKIITNTHSAIVQIVGNDMGSKRSKMLYPNHGNLRLNIHVCGEQSLLVLCIKKRSVTGQNLFNGDKNWSR